MKRSQLISFALAGGLILFSLSLPGAYALDKANISAAGMPKCMTPGQTAIASVTVVNLGDTSWSSNPAAPVSGCTNADNCPVHLSYHLTGGPLNVANGLRTDIPGTIDPNKHQTFTAKIKASDTYGSEVPLLGSYILKWQMVREHIGWMPDESGEHKIEVATSCPAGSGSGGLFLADVCRRVDCLRQKMAGDPAIKTYGGTSDFLKQGLVVQLAGDNFGGSAGTVLLKGLFGRNTGQKLMIITPKTIELPVLEWSNNFFTAGPVPEDLVGLDQDVSVQIKTKTGRLSNEWKLPFVTRKEVKLLPRSKMRPTYCSRLSERYSCCNEFGYTMNPDAWYGGPCRNYTTNTVSSEHWAIFIKNPVRDVDKWTAELNKGWKYHSMAGGTYWGSFVDPASTVVQTGNTLSFKVDWQITTNPIGVYDFMFGMGYWINVYVEGPIGLEP